MRPLRLWLIALAAALTLVGPDGRAAHAEALIAQVSVNGADTGQVMTFERRGETVLAGRETVRRLGLRQPDGAAGPTDLSDLPGVRWRVDEERQAIAVFADPESFEINHLSARRPAPPAAERPLRGVALNYGVSAFGGGSGGVQALATGEARAFGPEGVVSSSFIYRRETHAPDGGFRRLDTRYARYDEARGRRLIVGDFATAGFAGRGAARAGGVSLATDFTLRPEAPVGVAPQLRGQVQAPSSVEVYVDGVRRFAGSAGPGPFEVDMAPPTDGRGQVSLVVSDAQGRRTLQTFGFYASSDLLRPGVGAAAFEAGALREGYAGDRDRYGDGFAAFTGRRGLTAALTVDGQASATRGLSTVGFAATGKLGETALASAAITASAGRDGGGREIALGLSRQTPLYGLQISHRFAEADFADLATRGQPFRLTRETFAQASGRLGDRGSVTVSYSDLRGPDRRFRVANLGWSGQMGRVSLYASGAASLEGRAAYGISVGLSAPLGRPGRSAAVQAASDGGRLRLGAQASQAADGPGAWGWRAAVDSGAGPGDGLGLEAEVRRVEAAGEAGLGISRRPGQTYARAYATGGVAWVGGQVMAANQLGDSFAVVDVGRAGVTVTVENRPIGRTGRDGRILAPRLAAGAANLVAVETESIPLSDEIAVASRVVRPPRGGAALVRLTVRPANAALVRLVDRDGAALPIGAAVMLNGERSGVVGFDGQAYLAGLLPARNRLDILMDAGDCRLELDHDPPSLAAPLVCDPLGRPPDPSLRRADGGPGGPELRRPDPGGELRRLSGGRPRAEGDQRLGRREVRLFGIGLPGLHLLDRDWRRILRPGFRSAAAPRGRDERRVEISALP